MAASDLAHAVWRKSSRSGPTGDCVEVALLQPGDVAVRDSKDRHGPVLTFGSDAWCTFLADLKDSAHGLP